MANALCEGTEVLQRLENAHPARAGGEQNSTIPPVTACGLKPADC